MSAPSVAAVVLAAGGSIRMGEPKQLVEINGETLLDRATRVACEAGCSPVLLVLGANYVEILARGMPDDSLPVINDRWRQGMGSSIAAGIHALNCLPQKRAGAIVMVCDQPAVTAEHLAALASSGRVTASSYAGRKGVPAYFPAAEFPRLMALAGDAGARELLTDADAIELPGGELDLDTPADVELARSRFHRA